MEATAVNSDESTNNVSFESNKQEEATGAMGATSSKMERKSYANYP